MALRLKVLGKMINCPYEEQAVLIVPLYPWREPAATNDEEWFDDE